MDGNGLYSTRSRGGDLVGTEVCPSGEITITYGSKSSYMVDV